MPWPHRYRDECVATVDVEGSSAEVTKSHADLVGPGDGDFAPRQSINAAQTLWNEVGLWTSWEQLHGTELGASS